MSNLYIICEKTLGTYLSEFIEEDGIIIKQSWDGEEFTLCGDIGKYHDDSCFKNILKFKSLFEAKRVCEILKKDHENNSVKVFKYEFDFNNGKMFKTLNKPYRTYEVYELSNPKILITYTKFIKT